MIYTHEAQEGGKNWNLGDCPMARSQHLYQFHALCLKRCCGSSESNEKRQERYTRDMCGPRENQRANEGTQCLIGQRKGKLSSKTSPQF